MNFTSNVYTGFKPYVPENPVDAMALVGNQRQEQLREGIQKVQSYEDYLHGFDIAKGATRDYISGKINSLRENLGNIAGDFSDMRLVNQIGGLVGRIADDPVVKNGILSTAAYRKGIQDIEDSKKMGKDGQSPGYAVQNEWDFMTKAQDWLNDNDYTTSFSAAYTPHTDYMKRFTDAYKEIHPSSSLTQEQVRIADSTGQIEVLNEKTREGIDANEVSRLWQTISSDPQVQNQLAIDGRYRYKDLGPEDMYNHVREDYQNNINNINNKIEEIQRRAAIDKTITPVQSANAIEALRKQGSEIGEQYKRTVGLIPGVGSNVDIQNLDAAKAQVYSMDVASNLVGTYAWSKDTDKIVDSPLFKAHMEQIKYELDKAKFGEEMRHNLATEGISELNALMKGSGKTPGEGTTKGGINFISSEGQVDANAGQKGASSYYQTTHDKEAELSDAIKQMIFNIANSNGLNNPIVRTPAGWEYNPNYKGADGRTGVQAAREAGAGIYQDARLGIVNGKAKSSVVNEFAAVDPLIREVKSRNEIARRKEEEFRPQLEEIRNTIGQNTEGPLYDAFSGKQYRNLSKYDLVDVWMVKKGKPGWEQAQQRLQGKFGDDGVKAIDDAISTQTLEHGMTSKGAYKDAYDNLAATLEGNPKVSQYLQKREEAFKNLQTSYNPVVSLLETPKTEQKEDMRQKFISLAQKYNVNDNEKDFLKELGAGKTKDKAESEANVYSTVFDPNSNTWSIRVSRAGKDDIDLKVSERDIQDYLKMETRDPFWDKFGPELQLTQNTNTDITGQGGIATAHILPQPTGSKYQVKYHLYGDGTGQYGMRLFIQDQNGKTLAENATLGAMFNKQAIMSVVNNGFKDEEVEGILSKNR